MKFKNSFYRAASKLMDFSLMINY